MENLLGIYRQIDREIERQRETDTQTDRDRYISPQRIRKESKYNQKIYECLFV